MKKLGKGASLLTVIVAVGALSFSGETLADAAHQDTGFVKVFHGGGKPGYLKRLYQQRRNREASEFAALEGTTIGQSEGRSESRRGNVRHYPLHRNRLRNSQGI